MACRPFSAVSTSRPSFLQRIGQRADDCRVVVGDQHLPVGRRIRRCGSCRHGISLPRFRRKDFRLTMFLETSGRVVQGRRKGFSLPAFEGGA